MNCYYTRIEDFLCGYDSMVLRFWIWNMDKFATNPELYFKIKSEIEAAR
jgi:hypothetical protein